MAPDFPEHYEVRYRFNDYSEMTLIMDNLDLVEIPGRPLKPSNVPYKSVQHFNRKAENLDVEEFQNHLQYAKFLNWLHNMPSSDLIEVEISE